VRRLHPGIVLAALLVLAAAGRAQEPAPRGPSLGIALSGPNLPEGLAAKDPAHPIDVRIVADWGTVETAPGVFDWSSIEPIVGAVAARGGRIVLALRGDSPAHPRETSPESLPEAAWLDGWTALLRSAVATLGSRLSAVEVGERPDRSFDPSVYAFILKSSALAIHAEAKERGFAIRIAQGAVSSDALDWQKQLWSHDAAAYVDVLPVAFAPGADVAAGVSSFAAEAPLHPPAAELLAIVGSADAADGWASLRDAIRALDASAATALAVFPPDPAEAEEAARALSDLQARLAPGYAPAPRGGLALRLPEGGPAEGGGVLGRFLRGEDFATLVIYDAPQGGADQQVRLLLDTANVKNPAVIDPVAGTSFATGPASVPGERARALRLLTSAHPLAVAWERAAINEPGLEPSAEDVRVATTRGLTAQEIIARNQQVQKVQDDGLARWTAKGRVDFHFKLAQGGGSFDISIESNYFWRRGVPLEWQQTRYYVNGNIVTWKRIPEIPFIQPEKVVTLPLDLTFDKTYDYRLVGEDTIEGRRAYVLAFEPAAALAGKSLYRGRVWIDAESFVRLRTSVIQTNLEPPVLQNEETDTYVPIPAGEATYRLIGRITGQQLWTGGGRNFVVTRELTFTEFSINPPAEEFDRALRDAYASNDQMLRDTDAGFRYLERQPDGGRVVRETMKTSALFALAGAVHDDAIDGTVPIAGVNWFDYDFLKKNIQVDVFFAGVYAFANLTDPSIRGTKVDLGAEASLVALKLDEKLFVEGEEDLTQRIRRRSQYLSGRFGRPLGQFFKVALIGDIAWNAYDDSSEARDALAAANAANGTSIAFVLPANHQVYAATLQAEFNRKGYSITAAGTASRRSEWERWGLIDGASGSFLDTTFDSSQKSFQTWKLTAFKEWYLPKFQKVKLEADYLDGRNLDRFSQYQFGRFGDESLVGFTGTGVRFDTGYLGRVGWAFNMFNVVRLDLSVESARVRDTLVDDRWRSHTGAGLALNTVGPWKTLWQLSYGRALASDVDGLEGKQEFLLAILKLF